MAEKQLNIVFACMPRFSYSVRECIAMMKGVSPRIYVFDATELVMDEKAGDAAAKKKLGAALANADIFFGNTPPNDFIARAPNLKWIQTPLAGVDRFLTKDIIESPVVLTKSVGMHSQVAELAVAMMLMFSKHTHEIFEAQQRGEWIKVTPEILEDKTVGILGLGHIGQGIARFSKAFRMKVIGTRSKHKPTRWADETLTPEQTPELLKRSDFVVIALPSTPDTENFIGEKELRMMKKSAVLINIARGNIIDTKALLKALEQGWIAGAGLDVFNPEPLPAGHPLWKAPNVIITPHIGGPMVTYMQVATKLFNVNLKRFLEGKKLRNIVNKKRGY